MDLAIHVEIRLLEGCIDTASCMHTYTQTHTSCSLFHTQHNTISHLPLFFFLPCPYLSISLPFCGFGWLTLPHLEYKYAKSSFHPPVPELQQQGKQVGKRASESARAHDRDRERDTHTYTHTKRGRASTSVTTMQEREAWSERPKPVCMLMWSFALNSHEYHEHLFR